MKQNKGKPADSKGVPWIAIQHRRLRCPACNKPIPKTARAVQNHYSIDHNQEINEAEAHRIASAQKDKAGTPYEEGLKRNWQEVSGGAIEGGKRR